MDIYILVYGFLLFSFCLLVHIVVWRIRIPNHQIPLLGLIFIFLPALVFLSIYAAKGVFLPPALFDLSRTEWFAVFLLHLSLSGAYILSYPAAQAVSPSLKMLIDINSSENGCSVEELVKKFDENALFEERLQDLIKESFIVETADGIELTEAGRKLIKFFIFMRRLLGLSMGEG